MQIVDSMMALLLRRSGKRIDSLLPSILKYAADITRPIFEKIDTVSFTLHARLLKIGEDYAKAIQCAKVNLGLLSKGNRDLHTTRSLEIPAIGGLLCAERTAEHLEMYMEGEEALFWSTAEECASVCRAVLDDEPRRQRIAAAGHARNLVNGNSNEKVMRAIIERACALS